VPKVSTLLIVAALVVGGVAAFDHFGKNARIATQTVIGGPAQITADAALRVAADNLRIAASSLNAYRAANGTYAGASTSTGIPAGVSLADASETSYCIETTVHAQTLSEHGPGGALVAGSC
jgi:hypothetical protein